MYLHCTLPFIASPLLQRVDLYINLYNYTVNAEMMKFSTYLIALAILAHGESFVLNEHSRRSNATTFIRSQNPFGGYDASSAPQPNNAQDDTDKSEEGTLKANRFSKFAPDANLEADDFRAQLKENMKADLERRRREDPNRGNQPAKSYLDSLGG
eukprot:985849_1